MNIDHLKTQFHSILSSFYSDRSKPGVFFLLHDFERVISTISIGTTNLHSNLSLDHKTKFNIASVSKQFTAIAVLILQKMGKLSIKDTIQKWFPENNNSIISNITLEQLLSHSSGIPDLRDRNDLKFAQTATDIESYSYIFQIDKLKFIPGSGYEYQNPTYQLFYTIIERASGLSFCDFMKQEIFDKLKMYDTQYFDKNIIIDNCATAYRLNPKNDSLEQYQYGNELFYATKADGGLYCTASDFICWKNSLHNGCFNDLYKIAIEPRISVDDMPYENTKYGLGWFIEENPYVGTKICHYGDNGGFQIYEATLTNHRLSYLIFANRNDKNRDMIVDSIDRKISTLLL